MVAGRVGAAAIAVLAVALPARADEFSRQDLGPGGLYDGATYSYFVRADGATFNRDKVIVDLPAGLTLVGVAYEDPAGSGTWTPLFDEAALAACGAPPYTCSPLDVPGIAAFFHVTPTSAAPRQHVVIERRDAFGLAAELSWEINFLTQVRITAAIGCSPPPKAEFYENNVLQATVPDSSDPCVEAGANPLTGLQASPSNVSVRRVPTPPPAAETQVIAWSGETMNGSVVVNDDVTLDCNLPGTCTTGAAQLIELQTVRFPARLVAWAFNNPAPPSGSVSVAISGTHAGRTGTVTVDVEEQPVTMFDVTASSSVAAVGTPVTFEVATALNDQGGNEPRRAEGWLVDLVSPVVPPAGCDPATYLVSSSGAIDSAQLLVPNTQCFPSDLDEISLQVTATHTNPSGPPIEDSETVRITRQPTSCVLQPNGGVIGVQSRTSVTLLRILTASDIVPVAADITWSVQGGSIACQSQPCNPVELTAPAEPGTLTARAQSAACDPLVTAATFEVARLIKVTLTAAETKLAPGGFTTLRGRVENLTGQDVQGLQLRLHVGAGLHALRRHVKPITAFVPRPVTATASRAASAAPDSRVELELDVSAAAPVQEFSLPIAARMAAAGMTAQARLEAFYAAAVSAGEEPIDGAGVRITIDAIPELAEATLVGKVFNDKNGNGELDAGEEGVAKAMVALSSSVYALTDGHGRYHIARLQPGRVAVKLNPASLPLGAKPTGETRRELTLTPGMFSRVSFGVQMADLDAPPLALVPDESGARVVQGKPVFRATVTSPPSRAVMAQKGDLVVQGRREGARVSLDLPLGDEAYWLVVEREPDGRTYLSSFGVHVYARPHASALVVPWGPKPVASLVLPPAGAHLAMDRRAITGRAHEGVRVRLGAAPCERGPDNAVRCEIRAEGVLSELALAIDPPPDQAGDDPSETVLRVPVQMSGTSHFFVGLAGVEIGHVVPRASGEDAWDWNAGGAFFYRGVIEGKYLITAGADATGRELWVREDGRLRPWIGMASRLIGHDPRRVFRDLDPEAYYPVYGDASVTIDERESGGRFFARVEAGDTYLRWGGVNTAIDDAEVGRYVRSLYGLGGRVGLGEHNDGVRLRAVMFAAQPASAAARDELLVTGGTLYFLSHRVVVEGSLRVTLEMLDEISGLPVRVTALIEGSDYEADYAGGRIVLDSALPYRAFGTSLTGAGSGGHRARLLVEYEYVPGALRHDWSTGGRVVGALGPLTLGVTGVAELIPADNGAASLSARYTLLGGTARLDLGEPLRLRLEFAHSDGGSSVMQRSLDGGLRYGEPATGTERQGNAAALELSTGFGGTRATVYGHLIERGFADSRNQPGTKLVQGGLRLDARLGATELWANADHRETQAELSFEQPGDTMIRQIGLMGATQRLGAWRLSAEGRYEAFAAQERALAAAEARYRLTDTWSLTLRRRQLVLDDSDSAVSGDTALGVSAQSDALTLAAEGGVDDDVTAFGRVQGSLPAGDGIDLYAGYQLISHLAPAGGTSDAAGRSRIVAGGRQKLADGTLLYSEQSLQVDGSERQHSRTVGGHVPLSRGLAVSVTYERGGLDRNDALASGLLRDAASVAATYAGERWSLRVGTDGRLDQDHACLGLGAARVRVNQENCRQTQLGAQARLDLRLTEALTLALAGRGASSRYDAGDGTLRREQAAWEAALGFALRPIDIDWIDAFARYAVTHDRQLEDVNDAGTFLDTTSHLIAGAVVVDVVGPLSVSPKLAYAHVQRQLARESFRDQYVVAALRSDLHLAESWDVGVEGRTCAAPGSGLSTRYGALTEASLLVMEWLRLGAGYNFSSISVSAVRCEEPGARGVFVRAEAVY